MPEFLFAAAAAVGAAVALGLLRLLRGPADGDRVMAVQLLGTGGVAVLPLLAAATRTPALADVALTLVLVAAFASAAFAQSAAPAGRDGTGSPERR
jgi:multicomponent Na+:H+ antiporter subunit F